VNLRRFLSGCLILAFGVALGIRIGLDLRSTPAAAKAAGPPAAPGEPAAAPAGALACEVSASFQGHIYPSLILSLGAAIPEYARCLTLTIRNAQAGRPYEIRVESTLFQQPLSLVANAPGGTWVVTPDLPWNYDELRRNAQQAPELFAVTVTPRDGRAAEAEFTATVHSVNEAVSQIYDPQSGKWDDTSVCYAGFVNEDHPWINTLLQEAVGRAGVERFTGYQLGAASVAQQMQAVWEAMAARGLTYVDVATTSGGASEVATQYVRFLDQTVRDRGANCIDATVLFASIFRRIGLRPVMIFRPGHCFVAVYDSAQGGQLLAIETTMLGVDPFAEALAFGGQELDAVTPNLGLPGISSVDIEVARSEGVRPIGFAADRP
jgi:hypothetical protein